MATDPLTTNAVPRLTAIAWVSLGLGALQVGVMAHVATWKHLTGAALLSCALVLLAVRGEAWQERFASLLRHPRALRVGLAVWLLLGPLLLSPQLSLIPLLALPFTAAWLLTRGWHPAELLAYGFPLAALLVRQGQTSLVATLPLFALLLRRRPGAAFAIVLALGLVIRLGLSLSLPRPLWTPDSLTYIQSVYSYLDGGPLRLGAGADGTQEAWRLHRPPLFPALALLGLGLGQGHLGLVLIGHAVGLLTAWWVGRRLSASLGTLAGWQACAALALAPELMFYEHSLMSEASFVSCLAIASALMLILRRGSPRTSGEIFALGAWTSLTAVARPSALAAPLAVGVTAYLTGWRGRSLLVLAGGVATPLLLSSLHTRALYGEWSLSPPGQQPLVLFAVTGHQLDLDSPLHAQIKAEMRPAIERHNRRRPSWDPETNEILWAEDGPLASSPTLRALPLLQRELVLKDLATEAIRHDPWTFLRRVLYQASWRYWLAPRWENDAWFPPWEELRAADRSHEFVPPRLRPLLSSCADELAGEGLFRTVVRPGLLLIENALGRTVVGSQPFSLYKDPWIGLLFLSIVLLRPSLRPLRPCALALAATWAGIMAITCLVQEPIPRYRLQTYPLSLMLLALAVADSRRIAGQERPTT